MCWFNVKWRINPARTASASIFQSVAVGWSFVVASAADPSVNNINIIIRPRECSKTHTHTQRLLFIIVYTHWCGASQPLSTAPTGRSTWWGGTMRARGRVLTMNLCERYMMDNGELIYAHVIYVRAHQISQRGKHTNTHTPTHSAPNTPPERLPLNPYQKQPAHPRSPTAMRHPIPVNNPPCAALR